MESRRTSAGKRRGEAGREEIRCRDECRRRGDACGRAHGAGRRQRAGGRCAACRPLRRQGARAAAGASVRPYAALVQCALRARCRKRPIGLARPHRSGLCRCRRRSRQADHHLLRFRRDRGDPDLRARRPSARSREASTTARGRNGARARTCRSSAKNRSPHERSKMRERPSRSSSVPRFRARSSGLRFSPHAAAHRCCAA